MITLSQILAWITQLDTVYTENKAYLTELDSAIGDADHGINMARGFSAARKAMEETPPADIGAALKAVSMTLIKTVGGASGPLYGTVFLKASVTCMGQESIDEEGLERLLSEGFRGVQQRGKAQVGDKTMIDAWDPAVTALKEARASGGDVAAMLQAATAAAEAGRDATVPLVARKGRASYLGERSKGHQDPGATSTALLFAAARDTLS
ncbi:dihydroxyacetone kinase DhaL subunit [Alkalispirochaeta americana]|uniref:Dihydroxyacetone kinase DhaL subunit n=1 Tax=Alkalispirochaeta americana TaxID=159291 RepID=A0A1N6VNW4_9SPIO|nr:dihydroxyacetone kinase subunit DhaL [Alkalispirochaeta americana]SIQ79520.1 dihydroxyacetone kinase DhaL subunit [Alkalispirochaeta americana]